MEGLKIEFAWVGSSAFDEELCFSEAMSDAVDPATCSCANDIRAVRALASSAAPRIPTWHRVVICSSSASHLNATAATNAADDAICAIARTFFKVLLPRTGFSGTIIVSPGPIPDESTLPDQKPP